MKITFWWREIGGWALVVLGLWAFRESWIMLWSRGIFEAPTMAFIGFIVFRGGIHLLKVAVAARVAAHAGRQLEEANRRPKLPLPRPAVVRR